MVLDELTPDALLDRTTVTSDDLARLIGDPRVDDYSKALAEVFQGALHTSTMQVGVGRQSTRRRPGAAAGHAQRNGQLQLRGAGLLDALDRAARGDLRRILDDAWSVIHPDPAPLDDVTEQAVEALPKSFITVLRDALQCEMGWRDAGQGGGCVTLDPANGEYRITTPRSVVAWLRDKRLVILNATANPDTLLNLLERDRSTADVYDPHVALPPEVEIVQLTDAMYGKSTLLDSSGPRSSEDGGRRDTLKNALERVRAAIEPGVPTGLITFKQLKAEAATALGIPACHTAHFGAVAGLNHLRGLEQLVILGTFSPPDDAVLEQASAIFAGQPPLESGWEYRQTTYSGYRDPDGQALAYDVRVFRDPQVQTLFAEKREGAMLQAAHRLRLHRPNGRKRVRLIFASALPIADLPPTVILRDDTVRQQTSRARTLLRDALVALVDEQGYARRAEVAYRAGVDKSTVSRHWTELLADAGLVVETRRLPSGRAMQEVEVAVRPAGHQGAPQGPPKDGGA